MTSLLSFKKQIPTDTPYFWAMPGTQGNVFVPTNVGTNPNNTAGYFSLAGAPPFGSAGQWSSNTTTLLRDMGRQIVSSGRTFRRVQVLTLSTIGGYTASSSGGGTWVSNNEGVTGNVSTTDDNDYNSYYVEVPAVPNGLAQPIFRYGV